MMSGIEKTDSGYIDHDKNAEWTSIKNTLRNIAPDGYLSDRDIELMESMSRKYLREKDIEIKTETGKKMLYDWAKAIVDTYEEELALRKLENGRDN